MDRGQVVLVCPGTGSTRDRLLANFVVYDLLHAAKTRADTPPDRRREFYVFLDEVQIYDGASSGTLAGHIFAVIDTNGIAGYQAGQDLVIELVNPVLPIDPNAGVIV